MRDVLYECFATHFCDTGQVMELHQLQGFNTNMTSCVTWIFRVWHDSFLYNTGQVTELDWYWTHEYQHTIWMSHVTYESVTKYECVMSHLNEPCLISMSHDTYEWAVSRITESRTQHGSRPSYSSSKPLRIYTLLLGGFSSIHVS